MYIGKAVDLDIDIMSGNEKKSLLVGLLAFTVSQASDAGMTSDDIKIECSYTKEMMLIETLMHKNDPFVSEKKWFSMWRKIITNWITMVIPVYPVSLTRYKAVNIVSQTIQSSMGRTWTLVLKNSFFIKKTHDFSSFLHFQQTNN